MVLALPEDALGERASVPDAAPYVPAQASPSADELARLGRLLAEAERPLAVVGGQPWTADAGARLGRWLEASRVPVAAAWRCQDYVDNELGCYAGHLGLAQDPFLTERLRRADTLLVVGARLGDIETAGFTTIRPPGAGRTLIHVHPDPEELGRVYEPALGIVASGPRFAAALDGLEPVPRGDEDVAAAHEEFRATLEGRRLPGAVELTAVMSSLRARLGPDAIVASGAGNFTVWAHRFYVFRRFLMSAAELATARQHGAAIVVLVADNGMYGTIRMHQERTYPGRVSGTDLLSPDFAALARSFGCHGERVERNEDVPAALERALGAGVPAVLHLPLDPDALTPRQTLSEIRAAAAGRKDDP